MPAEFHWLRPEWLLAIPAVVLFAVMLGRRRVGPGNWEQVVDRALMPFVLASKPGAASAHRWWPGTSRR